MERDDQAQGLEYMTQRVDSQGQTQSACPPPLPVGLGWCAKPACEIRFILGQAYVYRKVAKTVPWVRTHPTPGPVTNVWHGCAASVTIDRHC